MSLSSPPATLPAALADLTLDDFLGQWSLMREITHGDGTQGRFEGQAWITAEDAERAKELGKGPGDKPEEDAKNDALYIERGQLILPGQGFFAAERRYRWDADLGIRFEDGSFFHAMPVRGGAAAHWCDPDQYEAFYDFSDWPRWMCRWRVRGPRKDYEMTTRYERANGSQAERKPC